MKIMFLRESEGVYQFGQRRVHIKVVGGGYMHVKQFVDEFTQQEVERVERHDALARFQNTVNV
jgi:hypothetical protein